MKTDSEHEKHTERQAYQQTEKQQQGRQPENVHTNTQIFKKKTHALRETAHRQTQTYIYRHTYIQPAIQVKRRTGAGIHRYKNAYRIAGWQIKIHVKRHTTDRATGSQTHPNRNTKRKRDTRTTAKYKQG